MVAEFSEHSCSKHQECLTRFSLLYLELGDLIAVADAILGLSLTGHLDIDHTAEARVSEALAAQLGDNVELRGVPRRRFDAALPASHCIALNDW